MWGYNIMPPKPTRRLIDRPGRSSYLQIEGLCCPSCGEYTRREFDQPSGLPDRPGYTLTDCLNPRCAAYYITLNRAQFFDQFGSPDES